MTRSQAVKFYAALDAQTPIPRLDPDRIWEEWQEIRGQVVWPQDAEPGAAADGGGE
jgi:hypothetical protein